MNVQKALEARDIHLNKEKAARPFLKWAGGKGQLLKELARYYPFGNGITKYAEPFVGGGAVLFDILNHYSLKDVYISDINADLIHTYRMIRDNVDSLIDLLEQYQSVYIPMDNTARKEYYFHKRQRFNALTLEGKAKRRQAQQIEKAALMIFLNKTCFNGLFRVNKRGLFNVPWVPTKIL